MNAGMRLFKRGEIYWVEIDRNTRRSLGTRCKAEAYSSWFDSPTVRWHILTRGDGVYGP